MKNKELLELLYKDIKALGIISNQYEFSVLCGRTPAWFSAIKARDLPMTTDAILTLSHNLKAKANRLNNDEIKSHLVQLSVELLERACLEIEKRHSSFFDCAL